VKVSKAWKNQEFFFQSLETYLPRGAAASGVTRTVALAVLMARFHEAVAVPTRTPLVSRNQPDTGCGIEVWLMEDGGRVDDTGLKIQVVVCKTPAGMPRR
jgi:hypothetical protein